MNEPNVLTGIQTNLAALNERVGHIQNDTTKLVGAMDGPGGVIVKVEQHEDAIEFLRRSHEQLRNDRKSSRIWWDRTILGTLVVLVFAEIVPVVQTIMSLSGSR